VAKHGDGAGDIVRTGPSQRCVDSGTRSSIAEEAALNWGLSVHRP
jgi:hypothetical protein